MTDDGSDVQLAPGAPADSDAELADAAEPGASTGSAVPSSGAARLITVAVGVVLIGLIAVLFMSDDSTSPTSSALLDRVVPPLVGNTLDDGVVDIDDYRGEWVLLNFFASWCIPCVQEHPELIEFSERHADGSASVISVTMGDTEEDARAFFEKRGGDWPVIIDAEAAPAVFGVLAVPETFLIAPSGVVVAKWVGQITANAIDSEIARLEATL